MEIKKIDLYKYFNLNRNGAKGGYLTCYIRDGLVKMGAKRNVPGMLVIPGGGYTNVSIREGEPIVLAYLDYNFNCFLLDYSVFPNAFYPTQLIEASMAMIYIRENSQSLNVNINAVCSVGFSAGGHICGCLGNLFDEKILIDIFKEKQKLIRPDCIILAYSVVSNNVETHKPSFDCVTNSNDELKRKLSLETRVKPSSSPCFIWTTANDEIVPAINSIVYAMACCKNNVKYELHVFDKGFHGSATGDEKMFSIVTDENFKKFSYYLKYWVDMSCKFMKNQNIEMIISSLD